MFSGDAINRHITEPQKCIGFSNPTKSTYGFIHFLVQNLKNHIKKQKFWFVLKETNQNPKNVTRFKLLAKVLDPPFACRESESLHSPPRSGPALLFKYFGLHEVCCNALILQQEWRITKLSVFKSHSYFHLIHTGLTFTKFIQMVTHSSIVHLDCTSALNRMDIRSQEKQDWGGLLALYPCFSSVTPLQKNIAIFKFEEEKKML